jgi:uncharacterized SAM-binding protein YcdF (DUF218 family)
MKDAARRARSGQYRLTIALLAAASLFCIFCWTARATILREIAVLWVVSDPLEPADAIAVLGGGEDLRPFIAADLYKKGLANKILVANVKPDAIRKFGITEPDLNREVLRKLGVPEGAVIGFGQDLSSTFEEARALAAWARISGARLIIVPTELFPGRRQRWILDHELAPVDARAIIDAHKPDEYGVDDWWQHEEGLISFQNEVIKYIYYRIKY